ncbi:AmmeMemoRadiSam system protein A [Brucepastera parasyntrophica]|uniref:AmmeMemoRadiSam system protein A n=1 Tax=Brucepastera parasyntrophica TaxID=2880008 RepID=UPI00210EE37B|nr:AmmeMemoRadiSam system protein A [Brucepastera parasyntrophica]ULQ60520.1 AmmeMemoRadiSam system protein A [Brucepastera parasyntrophica]
MTYPELARITLEHYFENKSLSVPESGDLNGTSKGVFVSLKKNGNLRGCIGTIEPVQETLGEEIMANAISSATRDPRFPPVTKNEMPDIHISVDVLDEPEDAAIKDLDPSIYGVIVSYGYRRGLLLPDLEGVDTVDRQVAIALQKAGIDPPEQYHIQRFRVRRYEEKDKNA